MNKFKAYNDLKNARNIITPNTFRVNKKVYTKNCENEMHAKNYAKVLNRKGNCFAKVEGKKVIYFFR